MKLQFLIVNSIIMSINEKKVIAAGLLGVAMALPMSGEIDSYANEVRTTSANVNFRTGPGTNYSSMTVIPKGKNVTYLSTSGEWVKAEYNSKIGYIHSDYLKSQSSDSSSNLTSTGIKYVNSKAGLNLRKGPGTGYAKVTALAHGAKVTVNSTSDGWSNITSGNKTGYVSSSYLSNTKPSTSNGNSPTDTDLNDNISSESVTKYVNSSTGLNVRKGAGTSYEKVATLAHGTKVTVTSTSNGWSKINSGSITGYVSNSYLSTTNPSTSKDNISSESVIKYVNSSTGLNVRKGAGTSYEKVATLAHGTKVTVTSTSNGWSKINSGSVTGYVSNSYLSTTKPSASNDNTSSDNKPAETPDVNRANKVIDYAKKQLGKPYVWGAQGPSSFDCSGFTSYVFKNSVGINIPRTSSMQSNYGKLVSRSNLQPGDLVFFDTVGSNNGVVTHCGIYIGSGQIIHAASGQGKVTINNLNSSYYINAWVNARRVL